MGNSYVAENKRKKTEHPELFTQVTQSNSLSDAIASRTLLKQELRAIRFEELEELILDTPPTNPKWSEYVSEYNNLKIKLHD